jgi:ADP-heptose:LPS heptosyltransferase
LSETELCAARDWLDSLPSRSYKQRLIAVGPGANWPSKVWPEERYVELVRALVNDPGVFPIVFGGSELAALGDRLISAWRCGVNAAGQLGVRQSAAVLKYCKIYVGNDTGPMHLAAATGTPCVGIFAAVGWPGKSYPYGPNHRILRRSVPCEGCLLPECVKEQMKCLMQIDVQEVVEVCRAALAEKLL